MMDTTDKLIMLDDQLSDCERYSPEWYEIEVLVNDAYIELLGGD